MTAAVITLAIGAVTALGIIGGLVVALVRQSGHRVDAANAIADLSIRVERQTGLRVDAESELDQVARQAARDRAAHERQLEQLRDSIEQLRVDLDEVETPGAVRLSLVRMFEAASKQPEAPLEVVGGERGEDPE